MLGIIYSFVAGIFITLQAVFNTRVGDKVGLWETAVIVHGVGFLFAIIILVVTGGGKFRELASVNKLYLLGGVFGVLIVYSVMKGITLLGASYSIAILLITQLVFATIIDAFGLFGNKQIEMDYTKPLGIVIMIVGIIIFKLRG